MSLFFNRKFKSLPFFSVLLAGGVDTPNRIPLGKIFPVTDAYSKDSDMGYGAVTNTELFVSNMIGAITILGGLFFLLFFFLGAFSWISAAGDKGKVDKAREQMTQGAVGMIIMIAAYGAIGLVGSIIGYDLLNPGAQFLKLVPGYSP